MGLRYTCLETKSPRSFLFFIVASVGPKATSRPLAVAYRQGNDVEQSPFSRVRHVVDNTLRLIDVLSDPANRIALEAELELARAWYQYQDPEQPYDGLAERRRPTVPDSSQPLFSTYKKPQAVEIQPELSWDSSLREFPFASTCLLLALLVGGDDGSNTTRPGDVQLQPLSTAFWGDCLEYGLVVLDISDLENVKYGIVAFPVRYMAEVFYRGEMCGWDPIEDPPPRYEPDTILIEHRPRVPLSILQYLREYFYSWGIDPEPSLVKLEEKPLVDMSVLNYIWPPKLEVPAREPSPSAISSISNYFWPSTSDTCAEETSTSTMLNHLKVLQELDTTFIDWAIDSLLLLTQDELHLDDTTVGKFRKLAQFQGQLRRRLEQMPDSLGPSEASGHILRTAYAGFAHLNWTAFNNISYEAIAAAIMSDELQGASAFSLRIDGLKGDVRVLKAAVSQSSSLRELCFLQNPDRESDDVGARLSAQLFKSSDDSWLRNRTVYLTFAFSAPLCEATWLPTRVTSPIHLSSVMHAYVRRQQDVRDQFQVQGH